MSAIEKVQALWWHWCDPAEVSAWVEATDTVGTFISKATCPECHEQWVEIFQEAYGHYSLREVS